MQCNAQLPDVRSVLPAVTRCSLNFCLCALSVCSTWQQSLLSNTQFYMITLTFKGVEAQKIVLFSLSNKREHTQAGLDSHLKALYSFTLVLLFSPNFSQSKAWPTRSLWFICLRGCFFQIGNISKHLQLRRSDMDVIMTVHEFAIQMPVNSYLGQLHQTFKMLSVTASCLKTQYLIHRPVIQTQYFR